jgi:hypothetical protein
MSRCIVLQNLLHALTGSEDPRFPIDDIGDKMSSSVIQVVTLTARNG